jgi:hypothetical protein
MDLKSPELFSSGGSPMVTPSTALEIHDASAFDHKCEAIRQLLASATCDEARVRYRVGVHVREIMCDETKYGGRAVVRLAEAIDRDAATLYRYALVPERWNESAFSELLELRTPRGEPLSWTHLVELASVDSDDERTALTMRALREGLSARALASLLRCALEPSPQNGIARLKRIALSLQSVKKRAARAFELLGSIDHVSPESLSLADIREIEALQRDLLQTLREGQQRLDALRMTLGSRQATPGDKRKGHITEARMPVLLSGAAPAANGGLRR